MTALQCTFIFLYNIYPIVPGVKISHTHDLLRYSFLFIIIQLLVIGSHDKYNDKYIVKHKPQSMRLASTMTGSPVRGS
jgi:hypothetical protein